MIGEGANVTRCTLGIPLCVCERALTALLTGQHCCVVQIESTGLTSEVDTRTKHRKEGSVPGMKRRKRKVDSVQQIMSAFLQECTYRRRERAVLLHHNDWLGQTLSGR